jgi:hypothetical protein
MKETPLDVKPFQMKDSEVNDGRLVRFWRKEVIQWHNTATLVDLYNEFLEETYGPISIRWWQRMEKDNKIPQDIKRRWVIATLLNIPPVYLGLTALDPIISHIETFKIAPTAKPGPIDVVEYETRLGEIWLSPYEAFDEVFVRVNLLQESVLYGTDQQKKDAAPLLCQYLLLFGNLQRARGNLPTAIAYLDKAIALSKEKSYLDFYAKALYLRGYTYYERWRTSLKRDEEKADLQVSLDDLNIAEKVVKDTSSKNMALKGAILDLKGELLAHQAQDKQDRSQVVKVTREAGAIIDSSSFQPDQYFFAINEDWLHIGNAHKYAALGWYTSAEEELASVKKGSPRKKRRYLTMTIDEAELYIAQGKIEMGTAYAEDALMSMKDMESPAHLLRVANLYDRLRQQKKYCNSPDVAHLGLELLKVRKPELFI